MNLKSNEGLKCGQTAYSIPSYDDLRGWILRDLLKEMQLYVNNIKSSWESTGCSILLDGWEDSKGQNLVNVLVTCPKGTVYIRSADIANFHPDSDTVEVFFEEVLADVGVKNVIQILSHSASPTMEAVGAILVLKATCPLVKVLDVMNNSDDSQLGHIYETMDQAKETIRQELKDLRSLYMPFWEAIDNIWNQYLHSPLHAAGGDQRTRDEIMKQVDMYQNASGAFGLGSANLHSYVSPVTWWLEYGKEYPELQKLAIQILSQTCSGASKYKLKRSVAENLLSMRRNQIEQQRLTDLAFVHYNLQLQNFESCFTDDISIYEMNRIEDWIGDNAQPLMSPSDEPTWMDLDCRDSTNAASL